MTDPNNPFLRRAIVHLDANIIALMIDLPPGSTVIGINSNWARTSVSVMVQHDALPLVDPACEPPTLAGQWELDEETRHLRFVADDLPTT